MQAVTLAEATHIVHSGVERLAMTTVALHTAAGLRLPFEQKHFVAALAQDVAALQTSEAGADDYNIVFTHYQVFFLSQEFKN
jgi:hypothetical protein